MQTDKHPKRKESTNCTLDKIFSSPPNNRIGKEPDAQQGMATTNSKKKRDSEEVSKWFQLDLVGFNPFQLSPKKKSKGSDDKPPMSTNQRLQEWCHEGRPGKSSPCHERVATHGWRQTP